MKNFKTNLKALALLLITTGALFSCSKSTGPEPKTTPITPDVLLGHYITLTINTDGGLRLIYFSKEGNEIKATLDQVTARRAQTVNIIDNTFTFDFDGDNQKVYTFKLSKNDSGILTVSSYTYKNQTQTGLVMTYAQIDLVTDAEAVLNGKTYAKTGVTNDYLIFFPSTWTWNNVPHIAAPPILSNYYVVSPGAWKSKAGDGTDYIGVNVPKWKDSSGPVMLVQKAGSADLVIYKVM